MAPLSVVVIARNEGRRIARCLDSVAWADERVVVDAHSEDDTVEVARRCGARVLSRPWSGFVEQKNAAVAAAAHDWVLSLDADEWLPPEASAEVRAALESPACEGFRLTRRTAFCGAWMSRAWGRDRPLRLFDRRRGRFDGGPVHESVRLEAGARAALLRGPILHAGYDSVAQYVDRMNRYTDLAAEGRVRRGRAPAALRMALGPAWSFARHYVLRAGFLDGTRGFIVAAGSAYYVLLREAKIWERSRPRTELDQR